jgi:hypothetical protein
MDQPINQKEELIKVQLMNNGLDPNDIQFRGGDYSPRYVKYSYWQKLSENQLKGLDLKEEICEDDDGSDDEGRSIILKRYSYTI